MRYTAATTIQLFVAALINLSAGIAAGPGPACHTLQGLIRLDNSDYLTAVGSQNVVFAPVTSPDIETVFEFEYCGDGVVEMSYLNGTQNAGLVGAVMDNIDNPDSLNLAEPRSIAFLAEVAHSEPGVASIYDPPGWPFSLHSQSTIWNYNSSTGLISAVWANGSGSPVDAVAVLSAVELFDTTEQINLYPVALVSQGNAVNYTTVNLTFIPTNGSSSAPSSSSSAPTSSTPTSTTSEPPSSTSPTASGSVPTATSSLYNQCGGINWTGSRQCGSGLVCISEGDYYSQCYLLDLNTILNADGTTGDGSDSQPTQAIYGQCGGADWAGITQCASGLVCVAQNLDPGYSQCLTLDMNSIQVPSRVAE